MANRYLGTVMGGKSVPRYAFGRGKSAVDRVCDRAKSVVNDRIGQIGSQLPLWEQIGSQLPLWPYRPAVAVVARAAGQNTASPCLGLGSGAGTMPCAELLAALRMRGHSAGASSSPVTAHHPMPTHTTAELTANLRSVSIKRTDKQE